MADHVLGLPAPAPAVTDLADTDPSISLDAILNGRSPAAGAPTPRYSARLTGGGRGWRVEILGVVHFPGALLGDGVPAAITTEERIAHAWTRRGARRKAERMLRRRVKRQQRERKPLVIEIDQDEL